MALIKTQTNQPITDDERKQARDCTSLLVELGDPNPMARRWAARDLTDCPAASAALVSRLQLEDEVSVREVILTTLTVLGNEVAVVGLVNCLRSEKVALRNEAIEAMKQLPDEVAPIMYGLLADADPDVRIFAVNILESLRHPEVESWLISVIGKFQASCRLNVKTYAANLCGLAISWVDLFWVSA